MSEISEWQLCPKCGGQGVVSKPPYVAGDVFHWSGSQTSWTCDVCNGAKILVKPKSPNSEQEDKRSVATKSNQGGDAGKKTD